MGCKPDFQIIVHSRERHPGKRSELRASPKRVPVTEIVAAVEDGLRRTSFPQAQLSRIVGCLTRARPSPTNLCPAEHKAIQNLKKEESIE